MERAAAERTLPSWVVLLLLVVGAIGVHGSIIGCTFFSDDFEVLWRLRAGEGSSFFRPLSDLSLRANLALTGPEPWAFRLVNLTLLGINGWLVHLLAKRLLGRDAALAAALLFILYPFHLEPQAWIIGRGIAMASAFTLGALVVATSNASTTKRAIAVASLVLLGSLCYESALLAPLLLGACWFFLKPSENRTWRAMVGASVAVVLLNLALRWMALGGLANDYGSAFFTKPAGDYLRTAAKVIGRSFLPPHENSYVQALQFGLLGIALLLIALGFWRTNRAHPERQRSSALLVMLFCVSAIIAVVGGVSTRTSESDRFLYLPSAFLCLLVAFMIHGISSRSLRRVAWFAVVIACYFQLRNGMENWRMASETIRLIVETTPEPPRDGRLIVLDLPSDHQGAYIFRHGYREALSFAGRDAERIVVMDAPNSAKGELQATDRIVRWDGIRFVEVRAP